MQILAGVNSGGIVANFLVVAGGGSGAATGAGSGGGGGGGGLRSSVSNTGGGGTLESPLIFAGGITYTIVVGAGGASVDTSSGLSLIHI